jgi:hypothetical protein
MNALRASLWLAGLAPALLCGSQAAAQVDDGIVLNIMRECARIDDPTARLACYDNNIRSAGGTPRASVPGEMQAPRGGQGAVASSAPMPTVGSAGFGSEDVRTPQRFESRPGELASLSSVVTQVTPREPGVYLVTLQDGAQWQFTESVDRNYRVPSRGDTVTIDRASLGSYLMRFDDQLGIRVRRVR